jgi:3-phosphoinositide dependent protein kinase-1
MSALLSVSESSDDVAVSANTSTETSGTASPIKMEFKPADFFFGSNLGEGSFARVVHAKSKKTSAEFAIKIMHKIHIKKENKVKYVMMERQILSIVNHPFIVKFHFSFQDRDHLYMCMDLAQGGELLNLISSKKRDNMDLNITDTACDSETTQFYISEIVEALEYLHGLNIIHRDLKPENILISDSGHIKVTDFGTAIICDDGNSTRNSFVGTQDYVSPEVLSGEKDATKACDLWAMGCMTYQMLSGKSPFQSGTEYLTFVAIQNHADGSKPLEYPNTMSATEIELIMCLLQGVDTARLGAGDEASGNGYTALKNHVFFNNVPWGELDSMEPPFKPDSTKFLSSDGMRDGAYDDWLYDEDVDDDIQCESTVQKDSEVDRFSLWKEFLDDGERMVFSGRISKRVGLFSKKRQLILTDAPRLIYVDPDKMEFKGKIPWTLEHQVRCSVINAKEFDVYSALTGRTYHLTDDNDIGAQVWFEMVHAVIEQQLAQAQAQAST